jgi:hypothetical protein
MTNLKQRAIDNMSAEEQALNDLINELGLKKTAQIVKIILGAKNFWVFEDRTGRHPEWRIVEHDISLSRYEVEEIEIESGDAPMAVYGPFRSWQEADAKVDRLADEYGYWRDN